MSYNEKPSVNVLSDEIVYYPETWEDYNGILIVLREPGGGETGKSEKTDFEGNQGWYRKVVGIDNENLDSWERKDKSLRTKYEKRFCEMLCFLGFSEIQSKTQLRNAAITNLKKSAGGSSVSKEYWKMEKSGPLERKIDAIKQAGGKTHTVFLLPEVFDAIVRKNQTEDQIENAIFYNGNERNWKRVAQIDGIWYFEIRHPSRSPRIMIKQSTLPAEYKLMVGRKG